MRGIMTLHQSILASLLLAAVVVAAPAAQAQQAITGDSVPSTRNNSGAERPASGVRTAPFRSGRPSGTADTDTLLQDAAERYKHAVGVVVVAGANRVFPVGTVWAVAPKKFATNAHVVVGIDNTIARFVTKDGRKIRTGVFILINGQPQKRLRVVNYKAHPKYGQEIVNHEGKTATGVTYDVGVIEVDEPVDIYFSIASRRTLEKLRAGYRVAFLGFPMEGLLNSNLNKSSPVATMQSGIVTAVTDFWDADSGFDKNLLVRHNLPSSGGASGSPIFDSSGAVVALLNASNKIQLFRGFDSKGKPILERAPNAALVNFAMRSDILQALIK